MKVSDVVSIVINSEKEYIAKNFHKVIKLIDAKIIESAKKSGKYPTMSCTITIENDFDSISGIMEQPLIDHYEKNGFVFTINSSRSSQWVSISWGKEYDKQKQRS